MIKLFKLDYKPIGKPKELTILEKLGLKVFTEKLLKQHLKELSLGWSNRKIKKMVKEEVKGELLQFKNNQFQFKENRYKEDYETDFYFKSIYLTKTNEIILKETNDSINRYYVIVNE